MRQAAAASCSVKEAGDPCSGKYLLRFENSCALVLSLLVFSEHYGAGLCGKSSDIPFMKHSIQHLCLTWGILTGTFTLK